MEKKLKIIIMSGAPCSGKTRWINNNIRRLQEEYNSPVIVLSKDNIRKELYNGNEFEFNEFVEEEVRKRYFRLLSTVALIKGAIVIIDNTNLLPQRIQFYETIFNGCHIWIEFLQVPLWKLRWRNWWRGLFTGKKIPKEALKYYYEKSILMGLYFKENRASLYGHFQYIQ